MYGDRTDPTDPRTDELGALPAAVYESTPAPNRAGGRSVGGSVAVFQRLNLVGWHVESNEIREPGLQFALEREAQDNAPVPVILDHVPDDRTRPGLPARGTSISRSRVAVARVVDTSCHAMTLHEGRGPRKVPGQDLSCQRREGSTHPTGRKWGTASFRNIIRSSSHFTV